MNEKHKQAIVQDRPGALENALQQCAARGERVLSFKKRRAKDRNGKLADVWVIKAMASRQAPPGS